MRNEELAEEALRLAVLKDPEVCLEVFDIFQDFLFDMIMDDSKYRIVSRKEIDGKANLQMICMRISQLRKALEGTGYKKGTNSVSNLIDPSIIASLVRELYETVSTFNLVHILPDTVDKKLILYNLWVISGLNHKLRFKEISKSNHELDELRKVRQEIEEFKEEIFKTDLYKNLDEKDQGIIIEKIAELDYKIKFENQEVIKLDWADLVSTLNLYPIYSGLYHHYSLHTHATNLKSFQFQGMFGNQKEIQNLLVDNLRQALFLIAIFIGDYIKVFPARKKDFEKLDLLKQNVINFHNTFAREGDYSINNCVEEFRNKVIPPDLTVV